MNAEEKKAHISMIFDAAVQAVQPSQIIPHVLNIRNGQLQVGQDIYPLDTFENIYIAGAGKATAAMAFEAEKVLTHHLNEAVISIRDDFNLPLKYTRAITGGHPLPNQNSLIAGKEIEKVLKKLTRNDLLIFLLSGGASSLMMKIPEACTIEEVNVVIDALLKRGATIAEMNTVRKHLCEFKGGKLIKKCSGATVVCFILSDVIGNDLHVIGSAPTVGDETTFADAIAVLEKYNVKKITPYTVLSYLQHGVDGTIPENPRPDDKVFNTTRNIIIASNRTALEAAKVKASELGYTAEIITDSMSGPAEDAAIKWTEKIPAATGRNICLMAGGETTVKVKGSGKGGRCQQFALAAAIALKEAADITLLAAGTDGSDGPTDAAGAIVDVETYAKAKEKGLIAEHYLENNDAYSFFNETGALLRTGATNTNVMDIVITLI